MLFSSGAAHVTLSLTRAHVHQGESDAAKLQEMLKGREDEVKQLKAAVKDLEAKVRGAFLEAWHTTEQAAERQVLLLEQA